MDTLKDNKLLVKKFHEVKWMERNAPQGEAEGRLSQFTHLAHTQAMKQQIFIHILHVCPFQCSKPYNLV